MTPYGYAQWITTATFVPPWWYTLGRGNYAIGSPEILCARAGGGGHREAELTSKGP